MALVAPSRNVLQGVVQVMWGHAILVLRLCDTGKFCTFNGFRTESSPTKKKKRGLVVGSCSSLLIFSRLRVNGNGVPKCQENPLEPSDNEGKYRKTDENKHFLEIPPSPKPDLFPIVLSSYVWRNEGRPKNIQIAWHFRC